MHVLFNLTVTFTLLGTFFWGIPKYSYSRCSLLSCRKKLFVFAGSAMPFKHGVPLLSRQLGLLNSLPTTFNCKPPRNVFFGPFLARPVAFAFSMLHVVWTTTGFLPNG